MPVARPYRLALDIALLALVGWLAAVGVGAGLRLAVDDVPPPAGEDEVPTSAPTTAAPLADYERHTGVFGREGIRVVSRAELERRARRWSSAATSPPRRVRRSAPRRRAALGS